MPNGIGQTNFEGDYTECCWLETLTREKAFC